ncbi:T9SS type A sorting domain-containing protein [bacterium]|nr:T9SS type A sorting domain-containing protein [bacterium]
MNIITAVILLINSASPYPVWQKVMGDAVRNERLYGSAIGSHLFVIGSDSAKTLDMAVRKFDLEGELKATYTYDDDNHEIGKDIDIGENANLYVVGHTLDSALLIMKYDSSGKRLWDTEVMLHYGGHILYASGGVYVAGWYDQPNPGEDLRLLRYDVEGNELWRSYDISNGDQTPTGLAVSSDHSIYISCRYPFLWCAWRIDGDPRGIVPTYIKDDARAEGITLNSIDQVFVCGDRGAEQRSFILIKTDTLGNFLWPDTAKSYNLGGDEHCTDIKLDAISDCYLAGWQQRGEEEDLVLVKTDSLGSLLWAWVDTLPGKQEIEAIEIDPQGYLYLAGSTQSGTDWDALVMKVRQPLTVSGIVKDSTGTPMKGFALTVSGDTSLEITTGSDGSYSIELYNGGDYTLRPKQSGWSFEPAQRSYSPLAHRMINQDFLNGRWTCVEEQTSSPSPSLDVSGSFIRYTLGKESQGTLAVFDPLGRKVASFTIKGSGRLDLASLLSSGVYFVRLETNSENVAKKLIILK